MKPTITSHHFKSQSPNFQNLPAFKVLEQKVLAELAKGKNENGRFPYGDLRCSTFLKGRCWVDDDDPEYQCFGWENCPEGSEYKGEE